MRHLAPDVIGSAASSRAEEPWILVVDDELIVRELLQRFLALEGYRALVAADGLEALALFHRHRGIFQAVVLDVLMPRMDGRDAFFAMRDVDPTIPVMVMSGFTPVERADEILRQPGTTFIRKPFVLGDVLVGLENLIRNRQPPGPSKPLDSTASTPRLEGITD
jgi:DNA-binding NtrC family response regulator